MNDDDRRRTDPLLIEVHGMLKSHIAKFEDHLDQDNTRHDEVKKRLEPVEELNNFVRVLLKVGGAILAIGGMGGVVAAGHALLSAGNR